MSVVLEALRNRKSEFDWLITDVEGTAAPFVALPFDAKFWFSGCALTALLSSKQIQFIWGVFSAFLPGEHVNMEVAYPIAEDNPELWVVGSPLQHPQAKIEVVHWDSTFTILKSTEPAIMDCFKCAFPDAQDLDEYIRSECRV